MYRAGTESFRGAHDGFPTPEETGGSPRAIREIIRARLRNLIHKVRRSLTLAQRRYKTKYNDRVRPVNKDVQAGDWVFVDGRARTKYELKTRAARPYKVLSRGEGTFSSYIGGYPETVSSDHVAAAPGPPGDPQTLIHNLKIPQEARNGPPGGGVGVESSAPPDRGPRAAENGMTAS